MEYAQSESNAANEHAPSLIRSATSVTANQEIAFIDGALKHWRALLNDIPPHVEVRLIDPAANGLAQLSAWAEQNHNIGTIHLLSHGSRGAINLGNDTLNTQTLTEPEVKAQLSTLGNAMAPDGDFLVYGCEVAADADDQPFISQLADQLGRDVAASTDLTGTMIKGGDWQLETASGAIESKALQLPGYHGLLATDVGDTRVDLEVGLTGDSDYRSVGQIGNSVLVHYKDYNAAGDENVIVLVDPAGNVNAIPTPTLSPRTNDDSDTVTFQALTDGNILVHWYSSGTGKGLTDAYFKVIDTSGNDVVGATKINTDAGQLNRNTVAEELSDGNLAFVWATDGSNYALRRFDSSGNATDTDQLSLTGLAGTSGSQYNHRIAANDNGQFMVVWDESSSSNYQGMVFDNAAVTPTQVNGQAHFDVGDSQPSSGQEHSVHALPDGRFLVTFTGDSGSNTDLRFTIFNADGTEALANDVVVESDLSGQTYFGTTILDDAVVFSFGDYANGNHLMAYNLDGSFQADLSSDFPATGTAEVYFTGFRDIDGNLSLLVSGDTAGGDYNYDTWLYRQSSVTPAVEAPDSPDLNAASDSGVDDTDNVTSTTTPAFSGSGASAGATVTLFKDGVAWGSPVTADSSGNWTFTAPSALALGDYSITATQTVGGTESAASSALTLTIDTSAPTITTGNISLSGASGSSGTFIVGDTVTATWNNSGTGDNNGDVDSVTIDFSDFGGGAAVDASNSGDKWSATYTLVEGGVDAGNLNVSVNAIDTAGNSGSATGTDNASADASSPTVSDGEIRITSSGSGDGGVYLAGDVITVEWNNAADGNTDLASASADFSAFGGGSNIAMTDVNSDGTLFRAEYTLLADTVEGSGLNASVTARDDAGNERTAADSSNLSADTTDPVITDGNLAIGGGSGIGGAFIAGDTVTATWDNTASGDNNQDTIDSLEIDFAAFGGGTVAASESGGIWAATFLLSAGTLDVTDVNISATVTNSLGLTASVGDTSNATVDTEAPGALSGALALAEDATPGQVAGTITGADSDGISYSLANSAGGLFTINTTSGDVTLAAGQSLDHEADASHTITVTATDDAGNTSDDTFTVTVNNVNEAPILNLDDDDSSGAGGNDFEGTFVAGSTSAGVADSDATIADPDTDNTLHSLTATLTSRPDGDSVETLALSSNAATLATDQGLTVSYTENNGVLLIQGAAADSVYQDLLRGILYQNGESPGAITAGDRTIEVVTSDGSNDSATAIGTLAITTAPHIDLGGDGGSTGQSITYREGDGTVNTSPSATVTEPDGDNLDQLTISLTNALNVGSESITLEGINNGDTFAGITITYTSSSEILLTGTAPASDYQALLQKLQYQNSSEAPDTTDRLITVRGRDTDSNLGTATNLTVAITGINDEPTLVATGTSATYTEGDPAPGVDLYSAISTDTIESNQTFTGLTLTIDNLVDGADEILNIDGSDLALTDGESITSANHGLSISSALSGSTATVTISGASLSSTDMAVVVDGLGYRNSSESPDTTNDRIVTLTSATDSGAHGGDDDNTVALALQSTITLSAVNDAPTASDDNLSIRYNSSHTFALADFGFSDVDGDTLHHVTINTVPTSGSLTLDGNPVNNGDTISAMDLSDGKLVYSPASGASGNGYASLVFTVNDGTVDAAGSNTLTLDVGTPPPPPPPPTPDPEPEPEPDPEPEPEPHPDPDSDGDGVPQDEEAGVPSLNGDGVGDGNGDGIADTEQGNVASLIFLESDRAESDPDGVPEIYLTLAAVSAESALKDLVQLNAPEDRPDDLEMPLGLLSFGAELEQGSDSATFELYLNGDLNINGYWKQDSDGDWVNLASEAYGGSVSQVNDRLLLTFTIEDGGQFDDDGQVNGVITDPGAPGFRAPVPEPEPEPPTPPGAFDGLPMDTYFDWFNLG